MIVEPDRFLEDFARAGADLINVHVEAVPDLPKTVAHIRALGKKAAVAVSPRLADRRRRCRCWPTWTWCC